MTLISCFECDFQTSSEDGLADHLWTNHRPNESREFDCPGCHLPVTKETFSHHYPCLYDTAEPGIFDVKYGPLCPSCGEEFESTDDLESHIETHSERDVLEALGGSDACDYCGHPLSADELEPHFECFHKSNSELKSGGGVACPSTSCECDFETINETLYHVWSAHFGHKGSFGECPGCQSEMSFGEIQAHLGCVDGFNPERASKLLTGGKTCALCGISVYSPEVLHRHYTMKHLSSRTGCPGCGASFVEEENADVLNHIICIANVEGTMPFSELDERWHCPACAETTDTRDDLLDHLASTHVSELRGTIHCAVCSDQLDSIVVHMQCLVEKSQAAQVTPTGDPDATTHQPIQSHPRNAYFDELKGFVTTEKETAREEAWKLYNEQPLHEVLQQRSAIPELIYSSDQYHPAFDHQLVYQVADEAEKKNPMNIAEKYGIFPGNEVILNDGSGSHLPRAAIVTFVDSPSIGFAIRSEDGPVTKGLLRELRNSSSVYHCVELINPKPFDRELKAVSQVQKRKEARNLVLGEDAFEEKPVSLPTAVTGNLNRYQKRSVERALGTGSFLCIHGPPGTGKTRTLTRLIRLAIARGDRVLATSHSNQAIDNLLAGSSTPEKPDPDSLHYVASPAGSDRSLPYELEQKLEENPDDEELQSVVNSLLNRPDELTVARVGTNSSTKVIRQEYMGGNAQKADLVTGTMNALAELESDSDFDLVVIDEAAQATQPASFIPLIRGSRIVLAGDHLQLPPYAADEESKEEEMHISLFEHLLETYGPETSVMLQRQYRMNEQIAAFPSDHIYNGQLETGEQNRAWTVGDLKPVMAVDVSGDEQTHEASHSKYNPTEARIVAKHVKLLQIHDIDLKDIGVITPYSAQIGAIRNAVQEAVGSAGQLKIDTIDSFQGSEREAIIVSFVRSNRGNHSGFLALPEEGKRRLNVALTRAKKRLVLIGDWNTLGTPASYESPDSTSHLYSSLYQWLDANSLVKQVQLEGISN